MNLLKKKLSSGRDKLMTADEKTVEAKLSTAVDAETMLERQEEADKKFKQNEARLEAEAILKATARKTLKDKQQTLLEGAIQSRRDASEGRREIESIKSPAEKARESRDLAEELFGAFGPSPAQRLERDSRVSLDLAEAPPTAPTEVFAKPKIRKSRLRPGSKPVDVSMRPRVPSEGDIAIAKPSPSSASRVQSRVNALQSSIETAVAAGGGQNMFRPSGHRMEPQDVSTPINKPVSPRPLGTPIGRHPLRGAAFYEPSLGDQGGAADDERGSGAFI